ncbi:MAG: hypothetical protein KAI72_02065, partial [Candidatus Pacebacteria bacterium]|nr:hypothetical protein [Candidatus Paceibacterota bacterium]
MALKTREEKVINLGNIVSNNIAGFVAARNRVRAARSAEFYQRVVDEGTDVSEQVAYFQGWLKEEKE